MEYISSKENKQIKYIKKLMASASFRKKEGLFVAEGLRLCADALRSGAEVVTAMFSESFVEKNAGFERQVGETVRARLYVRDSIFSAVSDTATPQGVLFVIKRLDKTIVFDKMKNNGKVLALENIQDPANLGTILRTAEAFGVDAVVLSEGCCDVYAPKVSRGSMGAIFRLPLTVTEDLPALIGRFNAFGRSYAAVLDRESVSLSDCDLSGAALAVIGNEGNGLTQETIDACTHKLFIPMRGGAESLNASVAASIILWEMIK